MSSTGSLAEKPIFIGGLWRSGTSLMRAIIASHPQIAIIEYDLKLWTLLYHHSLLQNWRDPATAQRITERVLRQKKIRKMTVQLDRAAIVAQVAQHAQPDHGVVVAAVLRDYATQVGRLRWGLKTPLNEFATEQIFAAYPGAKMIHMLRDLRDVVTSRAKRFENAAILETYALWKRSVQLGQRYQALYPDRYIVVRYEDLTADPEAVIRRVCAVIECDFLPEMLTMGRFSRSPSANTGFGDVAHHQVTNVAVGRFVQHLPPVEIAFFQSLAAQNGYPAVDVDLTLTERARLFSLRARAALDDVQRRVIMLLGAGQPVFELLKTNQRFLWIARYLRRTWRVRAA